LSSLAHIIGVKVKDTIAEMTIVTPRVMANSPNRRPTTSPMNNNGIKTAIREYTQRATRIVNATCADPLSAACKGLSPAQVYLAIFSIITIASSTTKPVAMVSAINDRLLRLKAHQIHHSKSPR